SALSPDADLRGAWIVAFRCGLPSVRAIRLLRAAGQRGRARPVAGDRWLVVVRGRSGLRRRHAGARHRVEPPDARRSPLPPETRADERAGARAGAAQAACAGGATT